MACDEGSQSPTPHHSMSKSNWIGSYFDQGSDDLRHQPRNEGCGGRPENLVVMHENQERKFRMIRSIMKLIPKVQNNWSDITCQASFGDNHLYRDSIEPGLRFLEEATTSLPPRQFSKIRKLGTTPYEDLQKNGNFIIYTGKPS